VKNAKEANLGSEMLRIACDLQECFSYSAEQQVVQFGFVLQHERVEFMRQREYDVEITRRQQLLFSRGNPTLARLALALWTVAIPTCNGDLSITCFMGSISLWGVPLLQALVFLTKSVF